MTEARIFLKNRDSILAKQSFAYSIGNSELDDYGGDSTVISRAKMSNLSSLQSHLPRSFMNPNTRYRRNRVAFIKETPTHSVQSHSIMQNHRKASIGGGLDLKGVGSKSKVISLTESDEDKKRLEKAFRVIANTNSHNLENSHEVRIHNVCIYKHQFKYFFNK